MIIQNLLRTIAFFLDNVVYGLIPQIYKLIIYLSEINLFGASGDNNPIQDVVSRIYVLLGIFMLFKVSFSLLQYLVDPNAFRDSSKGMGKLVTNVLVALVLLVSVPMIFEQAANLQTIIVQNNAIGQLILGRNASGDISMETSDGKISPEGVEEMAKDLQFVLFGTFYTLNMDSSSIVGNTASQGPFNACSGTSGVFGSIDMALANEGSCLEVIQTELDDYEETSSYGVDLYDFWKYRESPAAEVQDQRDFSKFDKLLWWQVDGDYVINYIPFISTAAGVFIILLLISFSVDIAVRVIKLCFLQMVAPIAIVSYIDPKESISNGKLNNWIKETAKTYFSLFLRLATIFLVMLLVNVICASVLTDNGLLSQQIDRLNDPDYNMWIQLFLIIGAFMFAKQVPKIIENIFGIKGSGEFSLNPFKTFANVRDSGFGALAGGAVGLGVGAAASGIAAFSASKDEGAGIGTSFRRGLGGAVGGALRGTKAGFQSGGKQTLSKAMDVAGIAGRNAALKTNTTFTQRLGAQARQAVGMQSKKEGLDKRIGYHDDLAKHVSSMKERAIDQLGKKSDKWKWTQQERANLQEAVKNKQDIQYVDKNGNVVTASYNDKAAYEKAFASEMSRLFNNEQGMIKDYVNTGGLIQNGDKVIQHAGEDYRITIERDAFVKEYNDNQLSYTDDDGNPLINKETKQPIMVDSNIQWDDMDTLGKAAEKEAAKIRSSEEYQDAETIDQMQKSGIMQSHFGSKH